MSPSLRSPKYFNVTHPNGTVARERFFSRLHMSELSRQRPDKVQAALIGPQEAYPNSTVVAGETHLKDHARW